LFASRAIALKTPVHIDEIPAFPPASVGFVTKCDEFPLALGAGWSKSFKGLAPDLRSFDLRFSRNDQTSLPRLPEQSEFDISPPLQISWSSIICNNVLA
jgi:hypothetical protein